MSSGNEGITIKSGVSQTRFTRRRRNE